MFVVLKYESPALENTTNAEITDLTISIEYKILKYPFPLIELEVLQRKAYIKLQTSKAHTKLINLSADA